MQPVLILACDEAGYTVEIDNKTYRVLLCDADHHLQVDVVSAAQATSPTTIATAKKTVTTAGTQVQFGNNACKAVSIKALAGNTGKIYVGKSDVASTDGYELSAGEAIEFAIDNTNRVWIDSSVDGEGVTYLWVN